MGQKNQKKKKTESKMIEPEQEKERVKVKELEYDTSGDLLCIATLQKIFCNIVAFTPDSAFEKDKCLLKFFEWASKLCSILRNVFKYWADYIDPCSGYPVLSSQGSSIYSEVHGFQVLLRYKIYSVGFCSLINHPIWGTACYPASIFTTAPIKIVEKAIETVNKDLDWGVYEEKS